MNSIYLDHLSEEALERFALQQNSEDELELVETHLLACDECTARLECLETEIAALRLALREVAEPVHAPAQVQVKVEKARFSWFRMPQFAMAGALAALALGLIVVPQRLHQNDPVADVQLTLNRGNGNVLPRGKALHLRLANLDLADGTTAASVVDQNGNSIWNGKASVHHNAADLSLPKIDNSGAYFMRLGEGEQALEFGLQVQ